MYRMTTAHDDLKYHRREIGGWSVPTVELTATARDSLRLVVEGSIVNSQSTGDLKDWKMRIASKVKEVRGEESWDPRHEYAISLALRCHRYRGDVDNYIKPVIDAIAAGLFCEPQKDPRKIDYWGYDDSNFKTLLVHRLPDVNTSEAEGVAISVSAR